jgi:chlorite dismutase
MPEQIPRTLNHFSYFRFTHNYYQLSLLEKQKFQAQFFENINKLAATSWLYQVYPATTDADILLWSAPPEISNGQERQFFSDFACQTNPLRHLISPVQTLWGFTRPSQYTRTRSTQEIDPFSPTRKPYLIVYPFVKTTSWYLMSREARQGMMNEHIRIGKQYPQITQLLLYSFGLQNQEFIVVYETEDLPLFSDLVNELRSSEGRRYTERDTPLTTAIYHTHQETLALWL